MQLDATSGDTRKLTKHHREHQGFRLVPQLRCDVWLCAKARVGVRSRRLKVRILLGIFRGFLLGRGAIAAAGGGRRATDAVSSRLRHLSRRLYFLTGDTADDIEEDGCQE